MAVGYDLTIKDDDDDESYGKVKFKKWNEKKRVKVKENRQIETMKVVRLLIPSYVFLKSILVV